MRFTNSLAKYAALFIIFYAVNISELYAQEKTVLLDYYFNHEVKKDKSGKEIRFHYTWEDQTLNGYSILGDVFKKAGFQTKSLDAAPTPANLKGSDIYIIVDPDNIKESPTPNLIAPNHIKAIADWVKAGGVLVLFANDSANNNLVQLNDLAAKFGINFTNNSRNMVKNGKLEMGEIHVPKGNEVFPTSKIFYLKEISILSVKPPAKALITEQNDVIMAIAKYGKGTVFAVGDPWLYNEYVDGTRIPAEYENYNGAVELVNWLKRQIP
ncbi:MAG: DUF4350 domain-containing protein [Candidatus Pedobacter colombiensis]|uniref:DUF4350 domain-containing protein n=1 Tax=Candidatus Pedobacter colombiensis TaxID=3121371 RepID=A0AAJ6B8N2_9SPHI|nr:DUF4350 domain-containing protein [Pedobacter sp.]WEK21555.1 MAG: DUF4350 domain-containing protein [Pedobacter sp.]